MNVFFAGRKPMSGLKKAVRAAGGRVTREVNAADAVVWTDAYGRKKAIGALRAGIPVYYAGTSDALLRKAGGLDEALIGRALLYVPYARRFQGSFEVMASQARDGAVGDPGFVRIHSNQPFPRGTGAPQKRERYEVVWGGLIHDIDWLQREFGPIRKVFAQGVQKTRPKLEYVMATFTMKSGLIAQVIHSYQSHGESVVRAEICGTSGIVQFDSSEQPIRQHGGVHLLEQIEPDYDAHWEAFEALASQKRVSKKQAASFTDPVRIADLTQKSIRSGQAQKV